MLAESEAHVLFTELPMILMTPADAGKGEGKGEGDGERGDVCQQQPPPSLNALWVSYRLFLSEALSLGRRVWTQFDGYLMCWGLVLQVRVN